MKKNMGVKIFAFIALLGIVIGIIGTGALFIFESNSSYPEQVQLTEAEIQELIRTQELNSSGSLDDSTLLDVLDGTEGSDDIKIEDVIEEIVE